jgi:hypothetical protein
MTASHNRAAYDDTGARVFWLGQVSEAATALASTRVPRKVSDGGGVPRVSGEAFAVVTSSSLSVRRDDSFYPDIPLARSHLQRSSKLAKLSRLTITLVLACTALIASGEFTSIGTHLRTTSDGMIGGLSSTLSPDAMKATAAEPSSPRLIAQLSRGTSGEPTLLGLAVHGPSEQAIIYLTDLVPGMELSAGNPVGSRAWEIPVTELDYAWIAPPQGFVGAVDLVAELRLPDGTTADRQILQLAWLLPMPQAPAARPVEERSALPTILPETVQVKANTEQAITASTSRLVKRKKMTTVPSISPAPVQLQQAQGLPSPSVTLHQPNRHEIGTTPSILPEPIQLKPDRETSDSSLLPPLQRQQDSQEIMVLLKRGKDLMAAGDLAAARVVLRKAADANNAEAALALAATYDPLVLRELKVYGFMPDAAMARVWYEKATKLGSSAAPRRLEMLTKETGTR